jgi:hypothetical protein
MPDNSSTVPKQLKPFVKGDPRINRKGRPKSFDALRSLAQEIAHEAAKQGNQPVVLEGHVVTVTEAIMRSWAVSKDPRLQQKFIEVAYGQVPSVTRLEGTDGGPIRTQQVPVDISKLSEEDIRTILAIQQKATETP